MNKLLLVLFVSAHALHLRPTTGLNDETKTEETDQLAQEVQYDGKILTESEVKDKMAKSTVVFMLPAKLDRSKHLPYLRANIEKVGALFKEFAVVVGTPDVAAEADQWKEEAKAGKCSAAVCSGSAKPYDIFVTTDEKNSEVDCGKWIFHSTVGKVQKACKIAKGRMAKSVVFRGTKEKTVGGLTKSDLIRNKYGKIVSKKASLRAKKNNFIKGWTTAVQKARKALGLKGFVAIKKGSALYKKAKEFYQ